MDRLTKRKKDGCVVTARGHSIHFSYEYEHRAAWDMLAAYEDTGLSPAEVKELAQAREEGR